jgi:peptidoglycan/LPS O-acetylase OafA/YrhL
MTNSELQASKPEAPQRRAIPRTAPVRYEFADALRGIAVLGVLVVHTHQNFSTTFGISVLGLGQYGVQLFYIVSAFTLAMSIRHRSHQETSPLRNYAIRRFFRIAPLFYTAVLIYLLKPHILPSSSTPIDLSHARWPIQIWHVVATVLFVNGWHYQSINLVVPGGWSVAVETNFYILLPVILRFATSLRRTIALVMAAIVLNKVLSTSVYLFVVPHISRADLTGFGVFVGMWLPAQLPVFMIGLAMYWVIQRYPIPPTGSTPTRPPLIFFAGLALSILSASCKMPTLVNRIVSYHVWISCVLMFAALILAHRPYDVFVNRFTVFLGKISYGAYLLHFVVLHLLLWASRSWFEPRFGFHPNFFLAFPFLVVGTMALATLSYRYVETPGQDLGRKWIRKLELRGKLAGTANSV